MIDATELKIGSWVHCNGKAVRINGIQPRWVWFEQIQSEPTDKLYPIAVTPEILDKVKGCERVFSENHTAPLYSIGNDFYLLAPTGYPMQFSYWTSLPASSKTVCTTYVSSLHILQQLYHSLTGKELEINLNN